MIETIWSYVNSALGLDLKGDDLGVRHMMLRSVVVFVVAIVMIRIGDKRFMGRNTALDVMLGFVFGSVISRAITGNSPFFPALAAGVVLVFMHWLLSFLAFYSDRFGTMVKGERRLLVEEGKVNNEEMKNAHISRNDLEQAIRLCGHKSDIGEIKTSYLERNGDISVIPRKETES